MAPELKGVPRLKKEEVEAVLARFAHMSRAEIRAKMEDPKTTMLEMMVGSVVLKAYKHGDQNRLNFLLDRTIGRVKEKIEVTLPEPTYIERFEPNQPVIELGATEVEEIEE